MYQQPWSWIKSNLHAPLPVIAYVAIVAVGVGTNNVFRAAQYDAVVEPQPHSHVLAPHTQMCLPRICIAKRNDLIDVIYRMADTRSERKT